MVLPGTAGRGAEPASCQFALPLGHEGRAAMAMELFVLSDQIIASVAEWQNAIDREGYPLRLSDEIAFADLAGFLPATLQGESTGFEVRHEAADEFMQDTPDVSFGHDWKHLLSFRWSGNPVELLAVVMASTAYAAVTGGVIFDGESGELIAAEERRAQVPLLVRQCHEFFGTQVELRVPDR